VLLILVEKRGELVGRQYLMSAVWPDTFVEESNLSSNISILRRQLGATPDGGDYIQTIPKRGYRFVAEVKQVENQSSIPSVGPDERAGLAEVGTAEATSKRAVWPRVVLAAAAGFWRWC
jgi:DNA-binding winged helix-turn-helix (wHTH) protein